MNTVTQHFEDFQIKPYCQEDDQTHKKFFGFEECAYCGVPMCLFCKDIPATGVFYSLDTNVKHPVCAYHKKTFKITASEKLLYKEV